MGTTVARKEQAKLAHSLTSKLPLKEESIVSLLNLLKCLNEDMKLDRSQFREVLHTRFNMVDDILMDRVFKVRRRFHFRMRLRAVYPIQSIGPLLNKN